MYIVVSTYIYALSVEASMLLNKITLSHGMSYVLHSARRSVFLEKVVFETAITCAGNAELGNIRQTGVTRPVAPRLT